MRKLLTHTTEISSREEYDRAMAYMSKLIVEAKKLYEKMRTEVRIAYATTLNR